MWEAPPWCVVSRIQPWDVNPVTQTSKSVQHLGVINLSGATDEKDVLVSGSEIHVDAHNKHWSLPLCYQLLSTTLEASGIKSDSLGSLTPSSLFLMAISIHKLLVGEIM